MNKDELLKLIQEGESLTLEFKSDREPLPDGEMMEAITCLANNHGGRLLVGVEDNGEITGLHKKHLTTPGSLAGFIASRTVPPISVVVNFLDISDKKIAVIQVPSARQVVATSDGKLTVRFIDAHGKPGCRPLYPHELINWQAERGSLDPSAMPIMGATWADLDPLEFTRLRRMVDENHGDSVLLDLPDLDVAKALGFVKTEQEVITPTLAGLLLVGKETALREYVPAHEVAFQVLQNDEVRVNDFHRWPLLRTLEWILEAFQVRNEERELNLGMFRVGVPAYDRRGFREAVNNALIHRDYTQLGAVHVQIHNDRIRISSPGGFVQGVTPDNLLVSEPRPRNPRLADAFKRIGLVERVGRGVGIIYAGQLRNGRIPPDYSTSTVAGVTVILPGGAADLKFVELLVTEENHRQRTFSVSELLILAHLWRERQVDTQSITKLIQRGEAEARAVTENLVESGLVEARGNGKGRSYILSASVYRELGQSASYVHAKGFESEQMEQMILQYVKAHGRVTRQDVMELCRVNENQAAYLLKKLVKSGVLQPIGMGRAAAYQSLKSEKTRKNSE
ncbi:MAG: ATP-binding protein [Smithella sp.]